MTEILALMFQYQVPVEPRDMRRFLKDYEVGGLERVFGGLSQDERQINREHRMMINGEEVPINPAFDNHQVHIDAHSDFQKSARYAELPPQAQAIILDHVAQHREFLVQITQTQMATQGMEAAQAEQQQMQMDMAAAADQAQIEADSQIQVEKAKPNANS